MSLAHSPSIVTNGLVLYLDAANNRSYPGSGNTWFDLSGNGYNFTLSSSSAFVSSGVASYMDLETYGCKHLPNGVLTDVPYFPNATICVFTEVKDPDGDWKTLLRSAVGDHQIIISSTDGISLGMYDNNGGAFQDTGFDMTSIPSYNTNFNYMAWTLSSTVPYYNFYYNNNLDTPSATLNASSSQAYERGFSTVGCYHGNSSSPTVFSQEWGKISSFIYYNRHLTASELRQNFNALRGRYGL